MADASTIAIGIAGASFAVTAIREIIAATRTQTKETEAAKVLVEGTKVLIGTEIAKLREEFRMEHDEELRRNGETVAAIRTKVNEVELWVRDNCVRIPHFDGTIAGINRNIELLGGRVEAGFRRIEDKLEKIQLHG